MTPFEQWVERRLPSVLGFGERTVARFLAGACLDALAAGGASRAVGKVASAVEEAGVEKGKAEEFAREMCDRAARENPGHGAATSKGNDALSAAIENRLASQAAVAPIVDDGDEKRRRKRRRKHREETRDDAPAATTTEAVPVDPWGGVRGLASIATVEDPTVVRPTRRDDDGDGDGDDSQIDDTKANVGNVGNVTDAPAAPATTGAESKNTDTGETASKTDTDGQHDNHQGKEEEEEEEGKGGSAAAASEHLPRLREISRREYVARKAREAVDLLEAELRDEEEMFRGQRMTDREQREIEDKRSRLGLARERLRIADAELAAGYRIPIGAEDLDAQEAAGQRDRAAIAAAGNRYGEGDPSRRRGVAGSRGGGDTVTLAGTTSAASGSAFSNVDWEAEQIARASGGAINNNSNNNAKGGDNQNKTGFVGEGEIEFLLEAKLPGTFSDAKLAEETRIRREKEAAAARAAAEASSASREDPRVVMQRVRESLPIFPFRGDLVRAVRDNRAIVIVGETGSGKTTQIAQYLLEEGFCEPPDSAPEDVTKMIIACTQPRRVAAMSVAARVADEVGCRLGDEVGYTIRFEDRTSERTLIKYMTDGMLLREFTTTPDLGAYSVIILDEAHERTLHTDILFGLLKDVMRYRDDLRVIVSSATLDARKFSEYFDGAPVYSVPGRTHPVDVLYTRAPESDYVEASIITVLQIHATQPPGDILVFLTGQEEIESCVENTKERLRLLGSRVGQALVLPLYAALPTEMQGAIFTDPDPDVRKIVFSTNIAETSLTIEGIVYVIDAGFVKQSGYDPRRGIGSLSVVPISRANAVQRAGRAGRTRPGKCFRLYTKSAFHTELAAGTIPDIQRTNLATVVLALKSMGVDDLIGFDFMDPPPAEGLSRALELLYALGALSPTGALTKTGRRMAEFPLDPMLARALLEAESLGVTGDMVTVAAMLSLTGAVFYRPRDDRMQADAARAAFDQAGGNGGDHFTLREVYTQWADSGYDKSWCSDHFVQFRSMSRAREVRDQLVSLCEKVDIEVQDVPWGGGKFAAAPDPHAAHKEALAKCITRGYFPHAARLGKSGQYTHMKSVIKMYLHPSSPKELLDRAPKFVVYNELVLTSKEYMRTVCETKLEWLLEAAPHYFAADKEREREEASKRGRFRHRN